LSFSFLFSSTFKGVLIELYGTITVEFIQIQDPFHVDNIGFLLQELHEISHPVVGNDLTVLDDGRVTAHLFDLFQ